MDTAQPDIVTRLTETLDAWDKDFASWQQLVANQLTEAEEHLQRLAAGETNLPNLPPSDAYETLCRTLEQREQQIAHLNTALAEYDEQTLSLQSVLSDRTTRVADLQAALTDQSEQAALLENALNDREAQLALLSAALGERDERIASLQTELQELQTRAAVRAPEEETCAPPPGLDLAYEEAVAHAAALEADLNDERERASASENRAMGLQSKLTAAQEEIARLRAALSSPVPSPARTTDLSALQVFDARGHKKRMGQILVECGFLSEYQLDEILSEQAQDPRRRFGTLVVERGFTTEHVIARILAAQLRLPFSELRDEDIQPSAPSLISAHLARLHRCVPLRQEDDCLSLAMANPLDLIAIEDVELATRCRVEPVVATPAAIDFVISRHIAGI